MTEKMNSTVRKKTKVGVSPTLNRQTEREAHNNTLTLHHHPYTCTLSYAHILHTHTHTLSLLSSAFSSNREHC
jgi:hypothetical protein